MSLGTMWAMTAHREQDDSAAWDDADRAWLEARLVEYEELLAYLRDH